MRRLLFCRGAIAGVWLFVIQVAAAQTLPLSVSYGVAGVSYSQDIPTPDSILGYTVGTTHTRPHQIVEYFRAVAEASDRVTFSEYGRTHENRPLIYAVVTSPANHARIEALRTANLSLSDDPGGVSDIEIERMPVIVSTHFSVHGNEASGSEAALLLLYYFAAGIGDRVESVLDSAIVIIDPVVNPDGKDRFVDWVNGNRGLTPTGDSDDREHNEPWPGGRTNHYWFDLNRDWLVAQQPESKERLNLFHRWRPQVLLDVHEMGSDRTFFFQPGIPSRGNPNTPQETFDLTGELTRYSARALDEIGSLYYSRESYDDFYYGKGSTFPDVNGSVGILFEQGSSRALLRLTKDGTLDFGFTIRNHLAASIGLIEGAVAMRTRLLRHQRDFYADALEEGAAARFDGWLVGSPRDHTRTQELLQVLRRHRVEILPVKSEATVDAKTFTPGNSYVIPARQPQFKLIKSSMETTTTFRDSVFFGVSTWTLPLAFGIQTAEYTGNISHIAGDAIGDVVLDGGRVVGGRAKYAYVMPWGRYYGPRALFELLTSGVPARVSLESFETVSGGEPVYFDRGAIIVPLQSRGRTDGEGVEQVHQIVQRLAVRDHVEFYAIDSGLATAGVDIGSPRTIPLHEPSVGIFAGKPLTAYRVGEVWHLLSERMKIPVSLLDLDRVADVDLDKYSVLVLVDGNFVGAGSDLVGASFDLAAALRTWVEKGGRLISMQRAAEWVASEQIVTAEFPTEELPLRRPWVRYGDRDIVKNSRDIGGAIFEADLDRSHPISFGLGSRVALFKTRYSILKPPTDAGTTVAVYRPDPLLSGYAPTDRLERIAKSAAITSQKVGDGRVVLIQDVLAFRSFWLGSDLLLLNAILMAEAY